MESAPPTMSIGALAQRTGVPVGTIRAWERRYGALSPERSSGGHRRYSLADVERVLWLAARTGEGSRIATASGARAVIDELGVAVDSHAGGLVGAAIEGDGPGVEAMLDRAFAAMDLVATMDYVVFPALRRLGQNWAENGTGVAGEHLLSEAVSRRLAARLAASHTGDGRHHLVVCCPGGEPHALGALSFAVLVAAEGFRVTYLGADAPLREVAALARAQGAERTVVVCTLAGPGELALAEIAGPLAGPGWVLCGPAIGSGENAPPGAEVWGPGLADAQRTARVTLLERVGDGAS